MEQWHPACDICTQALVLPYVLSCGHSFCYVCVKEWASNKPNCPQCRQPMVIAPVLNHTLHQLLLRSSSSSAHDDRVDQYRRDKQEGFMWMQSLKAKFGQAIVDAEDSVARCSACHWELVGGECENCGRVVLDYVGDEALDDDEGVDSEDDEDDDDQDSVLQDGEHRRQRREEVYESDDGFVVLSDDEDAEDDDDEDDDQGRDRNDEDLLARLKKRSSPLTLFTSSEEEEEEEEEDDEDNDDDEDDDDDQPLPKRQKKITVVLSDDEDDSFSDD